MAAEIFGIDHHCNHLHDRPPREQKHVQSLAPSFIELLDILRRGLLTARTKFGVDSIEITEGQPWHLKPRHVNDDYWDQQIFGSINETIENNQD